MVESEFFVKSDVDDDIHLVDDLFFSVLEKKYSLSKEDFLKFAEEKRLLASKKDGIPVAILSNKKLSSLESITKFLRENKNLSYSKIGSMISRNPKSLPVTYSVARRKMSKLFIEDFDSDTIFIPFNAFKKDLSVLESICVYLKSLGYSYSVIGRMLGKDQRTIWTVCARAKSKIGDVVMNTTEGISSNE